MKLLVSGLCKAYNGQRVLDGFDAQFQEGAVTCVMGGSGQGKTTLLRLLMGLEQPDSGTISGLEGKRLSAVFPEHRLCENMSPVSNVRLICGNRYTRQEIIDALSRTGLSACFDKPVRALSDGMKRRVSIVRALLAEFDLLLLDEPFRGLDQATRQRTIDYMKERIAGKTVVMVTHDPEEPALMGAGATLTLPTS